MGEVVRKPSPAPLPEKYEDLTRKIKVLPNPNDMIDEMLPRLWLIPEYREFIAAVYNEEAVTGSTEYDDCRAAMIIKDMAKQEGNHFLASMKEKAIARHHNVVLRRSNISRDQRRRTVSGDMIEDRCRGDDD
jgi:hypothetical protein